MAKNKNGAPAVVTQDSPDRTKLNVAIPIEPSSAKQEKLLCILGVDPGLSGGLAFFWPCAPDRVTAEDMPVVAGQVDCATLAERIAQMAPDLAVVEVVSAMPGQGVSSTFKFGASYGAVVAILAALKVRTVLVTPTKRKRHFSLSSDKEQSRSLALRTFAKTPEHFARKRDHNRAEAALLARYGAFLEGGSS